jgi:hypothetical protein
VVAGEYGQCYAKAVPKGSWGQEGSTKVYVVRDAVDQLVHTFDWYAPTIYIRCAVAPKYAISVVQMGPWARGQSASHGDLAFAFYYDGKLVRSYSTLDIAGLPDKVSRSVSHYAVIRKVLGYADKGNSTIFEVETEDGKRLAFDAATGEAVK